MKDITAADVRCARSAVHAAYAHRLPWLLDDLKSAGVEGLMMAAQEYDPARPGGWPKLSRWRVLDHARRYALREYARRAMSLDQPISSVNSTRIKDVLQNGKIDRPAELAEVRDTLAWMLSLLTGKQKRRFAAMSWRDHKSIGQIMAETGTNHANVCSQIIHARQQVLRQMAFLRPRSGIHRVCVELADACHDRAERRNARRPTERKWPACGDNAHAGTLGRLLRNQPHDLATN